MKSAAPPKQAQVEKNNNKQSKEDLKQISDSKDDTQKQKKDKTDSYSDDWGDNDIELEDKGDKQNQSNQVKPSDPNPIKEAQQKNNDFFNVEDDPILNK